MVFHQDARKNIERLGPTYIKMGQMLSVRPDVLPQEALDELAILQVCCDCLRFRICETADANSKCLDTYIVKPVEI